MKFINFEASPNEYGKKQFKGLTRGGYWTCGLTVAVIMFFVLCFRTVDAGQVGIITRFGEVNRVASSGIALKMPWPIERLSKMEVRTQKEEQDASAATSDLQDVNAKLALNFALDNSTALKVYKELGTDYKNRIIVPALQESFKSASAKFTASELLTKREEVKAQAYDVIKARLEKFGVRVVDLNITNFSFSDEFSKAIEEKQVAAQNAEKSKYAIETAKNNAQARIEEAKGQKEANNLLQESLTDKVLQQQAIKAWDGKMPNAIGSGTIFNIPLNK